MNNKIKTYCIKKCLCDWFSVKILLFNMTKKYSNVYTSAADEIGQRLGER